MTKTAASPNSFFGFKKTKGDATGTQGMLSVPTDYRVLHFASAADYDTDWAVSNPSHPTLYIHSETTPATDYLSIAHDGTTLTFTVAGGIVAFTGATAAGVNGYSFDMAAGTIATESHGVDITATGTLASGKGLVGLNVVATAAGTAGSWLSAGYFKTVQASKLVNGYLCGAEIELASTAANASDNSVLVLNSTRNHTGSAPACDPYITLREYGATYGNVFLRIQGDTGQGAISGTASTTLLATGTADKTASCAIRCMFGSTVFWLLGTTTAPS